MPLFEIDVQINFNQVSEALLKNWNIQISKLIQTCQNKTYDGYRKTQNLEEKFFIRVSPDPGNKKQQKIKDQVFFVNYLNKHKLNHICSFVPKIVETQDQFVYFGNNFSIVVITPVNGQHLQFPLFQWMLNKQVVFLWGKFFAEMHTIAKNFEKEHSDVAKRIQNWRQIHNGLLSDVKLDELDEKDVDNPQHYGVLHGDLNISNFNFDRINKVINAYDTDQVQRGFYLHDLSRAIFTSYMLQKAGMANSGEPVPQANYKQFMEWIVEGYESVTGKNSVDLNRLERMILIVRQFYVKFCAKALQEGTIPNEMRSFIEYIQKHLTLSE